MKTKNFRKLTVKEKQDEYGGWAWLATAIPLFLQTVMTAITSYKMLSSDKGSVKNDDMSANWETTHKKTTGSSKSSKTTHTFYAF